MITEIKRTRLKREEERMAQIQNLSDQSFNFECFKEKITLRES